MKEIITIRGEQSKHFKYFITSDGKVFNESRAGNIKEMFYHVANGYRRVRIKDTKTGIRRYYRVSRLVAEYYIPNNLNKPYVNHIDGIKSNDIVNNLEWVTNSENTIHAYKTGLTKDRGGWISRRLKMQVNTEGYNI